MLLKGDWEIIEQESLDENVTQVYGIRCKVEDDKIQDWDYDTLTNLTFLYEQRRALFNDIQEDGMAVPEFFFEIKRDVSILRDLVVGKFNVLLVIEGEK